MKLKIFNLCHLLFSNLNAQEKSNDLSSDCILESTNILNRGQSRDTCRRFGWSEPVWVDWLNAVLFLMSQLIKHINGMKQMD